MFTLGYKLDKKAVPVAYINGGMHNGKVLFLNKENLDCTLDEKDNKSDVTRYASESSANMEHKKAKEKKKFELYDYCNEDQLKFQVKKIYGKSVRFDPRDFLTISNLIKLNIEPNDERMKMIYNTALDFVKNYFNNNEYTFDKCGFREFICRDGLMQQLPRKNENNDIILRHYLAAPSESGKSYYIANLLKEYKQLKPDCKIYLFSDTKEDEILDKLGLIRIALDNDLAENPIEAVELANDPPEDGSIVIMDDIDSIIDKKISKAVKSLRDQLLQKGRHHKISTICTNHKLADRQNTAIPINESNFITLFPKATAPSHFRYILQTYCGFSNNEVQMAYNLPGRWITISKQFPQYILYQSGAILLNRGVATDKDEFK